MAFEPDTWRSLARRHPGLALLVLIGSRANRQEHEGSDWDLGVLGLLGLLGDPTPDVASLWADATSSLATDALDVVDLASASAVLRRDAAAQGRLLCERSPGAFVAVQIEAASSWCDVEVVVREAHADVLRAAAR